VALMDVVAAGLVWHAHTGSDPAPPLLSVDHTPGEAR
jgi:hypothetical protein